MKDHILFFESQEAAQQALPTYWFAPSSEEEGYWHGQFCLPEVTAAAGGIGGELLPGWGIWISRQTVRDELQQMPECKFVGDRETATALTPEYETFMNSYFVEPIPGGSAYPWAGVSPLSSAAPSKPRGR